MNHAEHTRWQEAVRHLLAVHRPEAAEQLVRRRLATHAQETAAHELLGLVLLNQPRRNAEALAVIRQAIALDPQQPDAHYFHSVALLRASQPFAALQAIEEALRLNPRGATYLGYKAVILNACRQPEQALAAADGGLFLDPGHLECLFQRIQALQHLGRWPDAATTIQQLARWHPTSWLSHCLLGEEAVRRQQLAAAVPHLEEAVRLAPTSLRPRQQLAPVLLSLGRQARQEGQPQVARSYFWQVWHLEPHNLEARQELVQLAQNSFWLKRQLGRLDAWYEELQLSLKQLKITAWLQLFLVLLPLIAVLCLPLVVLLLVAAMQWRLHPDVRELRQHSRRAAIGEVGLLVSAGVGGLGLLVGLRLWLDTVSEDGILVLLTLLALGIGVVIRTQHSPSSTPE